MYGNLGQAKGKNFGTCEGGRNLTFFLAVRSCSSFSYLSNCCVCECVRQSDEIIIHPPTEREIYISFLSHNPATTDRDTIDDDFSKSGFKFVFFRNRGNSGSSSSSSSPCVTEGEGGESLNERQRRRETKKTYTLDLP